MNKMNWSETLNGRQTQGLTAVYGGWKEKGIDSPALQNQSPELLNQAGSRFLPGTYKLVMEYQQAKDSTMITIKDDPKVGQQEYG